MNDLDAPGGSRNLQLAWLATQDPQVRRLALRWAHGDPDLAEDGRHTAYCQVAALKNPERIKNLRAYFLRVLRNEIANQLVLRRAVTPVEDLEDAMDPGLSGTAVCGSDPARPIDETVCTSLHIQFVRKRLADEHDRLLDAIPARSDDPDLYKATIFAAAEQVPSGTLDGEAADSNAALQKAYPAYFDQSGASQNLRHQRFLRARKDVRAVLLAVIDPDDLA